MHEAHVCCIDCDAYLRGHAEYMRIILNKSPHASEARKRSASFISMDDTKLSHSDRKLFITSVPRVKDKAVSRTIHGLERPFLFFDVKNKHVILIILPVARRFP